jgi:hypothetical protein
MILNLIRAIRLVILPQLYLDVSPLFSLSLLTLQASRDMFKKRRTEYFYNILCRSTAAVLTPWFTIYLDRVEQGKDYEHEYSQ